MKFGDAQPAMRLAEDCCYVPGFIPAAEANHLMLKLQAELNWQQQSIRIFGREVMQPRLICWQGEPDAQYSYSGLSLEPETWHPDLDILRISLQGYTGHPFNSVLVNAYRNGQDSMGWHSDDEWELGTRPVIASVSLGVERMFRWRRKARGNPAASSGERPKNTSCGLKLQHGSLLLMSGDFQHRFQHAVPKTARPCGWRINLTFRQINALRKL